MKAVIFKKYGPPGVLRLEEIEKPVPKENEVLVKVRASSINDWDWGLLRGKPFMNRVAFGLLRPKISILGADVAGEVEATGQKADRFQPGDKVFGDMSGYGFGGFAEYVSVPEKALTLLPPGLSFEEAAAVPQGGLLALQGLRHKGTISPKHRVLINGAGGGAGTFAIQIAKSLGAEVTGVDRTVKLEVMRSAGADQVIDYTREDFTEKREYYDRILDFAAYHPILHYKRALKSGGIYTIAGGSTVQILQISFLGPIISVLTGKKMGLLLHKQNKGLDLLIDIINNGTVKPVIDRIYPLAEVSDAFRYFGEGKACGKVIISIPDNSRS